METSALHIKSYEISSLKPYQNNPRTHSRRQIRQIADSIEAFGFTNPVLIDKDRGVIAGHGRLEAAKALGMSKVPTIMLEHMTEAQKRAYIIADNRLAERAGWDKEILAIEFSNLIELDSTFDLTLTGFEMGEIDVLLQEKDPDTDAADAIPDVSGDPITKLGNVWVLGDHFVVCGNALEPNSYKELMQGAKADMVFTDPPYNVRIQGHVSGLGKSRHEEFAMASGEMTESQFVEFLKTSFENLIQFSKDGSLHFVCMDWRHMREILQAGNAYDEVKNLCVWNKDRGGMGSLYRSKHELVFLFKNGRASHTNNIELGKHGRYRSNVWDYPAATALLKGDKSDLAMHPTVKPVRMIADAIKDCSNAGDLILDPFGGSGSTLIAAEKTRRKARLIELEPKYVDVTIVRWQQLTGKKAIRDHDGVFYDDAKREAR